MEKKQNCISSKISKKDIANLLIDLLFYVAWIYKKRSLNTYLNQIFIVFNFFDIFAWYIKF